MSADAIALFRPRDPSKLAPFLDLDEESEDSDGFYAEALDDGTMLVHTFQPFAVFAENPAEAYAWLAQFGAALPDVHDDPRGVLFFPDSIVPSATTYEGVVEEVGNAGQFVPMLTAGLAFDEDAPAMDFDAFRALAGRLLGADPGAIQGGGAFEMAKLFETMNQELMATIARQASGEGIDGDNGVIDEEFEGDAPASDPLKRR